MLRGHGGRSLDGPTHVCTYDTAPKQQSVSAERAFLITTRFLTAVVPLAIHHHDFQVKYSEDNLSMLKRFCSKMQSARSHSASSGSSVLGKRSSSFSSGSGLR